MKGWGFTFTEERVRFTRQLGCIFRWYGISFGRFSIGVLVRMRFDAGRGA